MNVKNSDAKERCRLYDVMGDVDGRSRKILQFLISFCVIEHTILPSTNCTYAITYVQSVKQ